MWTNLYRHVSVFLCRWLPDTVIPPHLTYPLTLSVVGDTTEDSTTNFLHFSLFSTALWDLANSRPVHSLTMSSHLFFCLPCRLLPSTVPCKMILAIPDEQETCPYHFSLCLLWHRLLFLVTWSLYEICSVVSCISTSFPWLCSSLQLCCAGSWFTSIQEDECDRGVYQSYLGTERDAPVVPNWFQPCQCCFRLCYPGEYLRLGTLVR